MEIRLLHQLQFRFFQVLRSRCPADCVLVSVIQVSIQNSRNNSPRATFDRLPLADCSETAVDVWYTPNADKFTKYLNTKYDA